MHNFIPGNVCDTEAALAKDTAQNILPSNFRSDGKLVLLDYKTDAVSTGNELVQRYKTQLDYYTESLENITGMRVKERLLYAFKLDEIVEVD